MRSTALTQPRITPWTTAGIVAYKTFAQGASGHGWERERERAFVRALRLARTEPGAG
jgi:hypothetical protein